MSKALVTLATGPHQKLLDIAMPSFEAFAERHGYDLLIPDVQCDRPVSWWKIPALRAALQEGYEEALWVDADIMIVDPSQDLGAPENAWQALVEHHTGDGAVPNCAVWLVRPAMLEILDEIWTMTHRVAHGWWEQAALMDLMGYQHHDRPAYLSNPTIIHDNTHFLDNGFNFHRWDTPGPRRVRFAHATMHPDREAVMREWAAGTMPDRPGTECGHRYFIDRCPYCEAFFKKEAA